MNGSTPPLPKRRSRQPKRKEGKKERLAAPRRRLQAERRVGQDHPTLVQLHLQELRQLLSLLGLCDAASNPRSGRRRSLDLALWFFASVLRFGQVGGNADPPFKLAQLSNRKMGSGGVTVSFIAPRKHGQPKAARPSPSPAPPYQRANKIPMVTEDSLGSRKAAT